MTNMKQNIRRNEIGGYPYEIEKTGTVTIIRFFPQPSARYLNDAILVLRLTEKDR
jgi:hypothetical protein